MGTRLVDSGWEQLLKASRARAPQALDIAAPFIRAKPMAQLLTPRGSEVRVITRFSHADFASAISEIAALRSVLAAGGRVRGVKNLHAKLYLFGGREAVVTSANLTSAALNRNHEFGLHSDDDAVVSSAQAYFDRLWETAVPDVTMAQLAQWERQISDRLARQPNGAAEAWPDYGADVGLDQQIIAPLSASGADRAFVKFLGEGNNRSMLSDDTLEEVRRSGAHWALGYPALRRPRQVQDGDAMFIARLTQLPNDIIVFGRAVGRRHVDDRDVATEAEMRPQVRAWKRQWPNYIRVSDAKFVAGPLAHGVSLYGMIEALGYRAFRSTLDNHHRGRGNQDPYQAYRQAAQVQLTGEGQAWLSEALERKIQAHGAIPQDDLDRIEAELKETE